VEETLQPVEAGRVNVLEALTEWAERKDGPQFFALLGEYGTGKTIACQRLVRELSDLRARDVAAPLPLYFDLRHVTGLDKGAPTLAKTLEECMARGWIDQNARFTLERLYQSMASQSAVVILDGLDEVLVKLSEADGQVFTRNLYKIAEDIKARRERGKRGNIPPLKMLISCRTHFFRTLREQKNHFTGQERG
jgi:predicted NACHT family NTPase